MASPGSERADVALVARGLFPSRARARAAIEAGLVQIDGRPVTRPAEPVPSGASVVAAEPHPWVSRAGVKLAAALDAVGLGPAGLDCVDVGASTGGFTDVLLARGARSVLAVDVGRGQLHPRLAADPRVMSREATDARDLPGLVPAGAFGFGTVDVSFISLRLVLPALAPVLAPGATLVALVKPQFEVGRAGVGRGGIVRDEALRAAAIDRIEAALPGFGFQLIARLASPIAGGDGNREELVAVCRLG